MKELVGPRLNELILGPKGGSNGNEGREVRDEVPGHDWHFRQFDSRFRMGKEDIKRAEEEALHVVQGSYADSCTAKTKLWTIRRRRNRTTKSCWPPLCRQRVVSNQLWSHDLPV